MISRIALALAIAAVSTSAPAQTNKQSWQDLIKPYEAKTNPNVPLAPPAPPPAPVQPQASEGLLDTCIVSAIGQLPKADGLRVTKSSYQFLEGSFLNGQPTELYDVFVSVDLNGRQATYRWRCRTYANSETTLFRQ